MISRARCELLGTALVMLVVPLTTSALFPHNWTYIEPANRSYHHMQLTVYTAFSGSALTLSFFSTDTPWSSLLAMLAYYLLVHLTLWAVNGTWAQVTTWTVVLISLGWVKTTRELPQWISDLRFGAFQHWRKGAVCASRLKVLSLIFSVLPVGMLSGPTFAPWEPVQKFVRWHPYNVGAELIWRGNFFVFATSMLITASNPIRHGAIILFFAWHGVLHGSVMLLDNRRNLDGNGNPEHAIEISFFLALGLFCAYCVRPVLPRLSGHAPVSSSEC